MKSDLPKISIVTPSFNQANFLEATIQSIISQQYPNLEYIIIDGGSTDGSVEIIKKYEKYLSFWCSEPDKGQYDAINKGFSHSTGEILAWLNSDDMYYPWTLKTVASIMSQLNDIKWLTTLQPGHWDWHSFSTGFASLPGYSLEAFLDGYYIPFGTKSIGYIQQESTFWRRSLWEKVGSLIRTDFKLAGDFDLWSRFICHADLYGVNSPLGGFRSQVNQKSSNINLYVEEAKISLAEIRNIYQYNLSFNFYRHLIQNLKVDMIPKFRHLFKTTYGYVGKRVIREKPEMPDSSWKIEEYVFYKKFISLV